MEKIVENTITSVNEKFIANILHDIKSPLYSIKIALQNKLDTELHKDIFDVILNTLNYIENFLVIYSFKQGKFKHKLSPCNLKELIDIKIENLKYIFIERGIRFDFWIKEDDYTINTIPIFVSSIVSNIISNIALHAKSHKLATIEMYKKNSFVVMVFKNFYEKEESNFSLGLDFCKSLLNPLKAEFRFIKEKDTVTVEFKVPIL